MLQDSAASEELQGATAPGSPAADEQVSSTADSRAARAKADDGNEKVVETECTDPERPGGNMKVTRGYEGEQGFMVSRREKRRLTRQATCCETAGPETCARHLAFVLMWACWRF